MKFVLTFLTAIGCMLAVAGVSAETSDVIHLKQGQVFEITTDAGSPSADFNWILTKDRAFQAAARTRFFQSRLTVPGTYVLDVSIQDAQSNQQSYRAFTIIVDENQAPLPPQRNQMSGLQAGIVLKDTDGSIVAGVPEQGGLIVIDPSASQGRIDSFQLDLDSTVDSNNDGNPVNDNDTTETSFEKAGTPIYVYMLPRPGRSLTLSVSNGSGEPANSITQPVLYGVTIGAETSGTVQHAGPIAVENRDGRLTFSVALDPAQIAGRQLLYEWDFGDRTRSLLTKPTHAYQAAGVYAVTVRIRDIATAEELFQSTQNITVDLAGTNVSSSASSIETGTTGGNQGSGSSFSIWSFLPVLLIIVLLLGLAIGLYALLVWLKSKTTTGIQKTLEKMEGAIVEKKEGTAPAVNAMPLTHAKSPTVLSEEEVVEQEKAHTEFSPSQAAAPTTNAGPVPDWLKKSPTEASASSPKPVPTTPPPVTRTNTPAPSPSKNPPLPKPPAPAASPVAPKPTQPPVTQNPTNPSPTNGTKNDGPVPEWLKKPTTPPPPVATKPADTTPKTTTNPQATQSPVTQKEVSPAPQTKDAKSAPEASISSTNTTKQEKKPENDNDDDPPIAIIRADSVRK